MRNWRSKVDIDDEVLLLWSTVDGTRFPTLRDRNCKLLEPFTSYLHSAVIAASTKAQGLGARSEIEAKTYALKSFAIFLAQRRRRLYRVDDAFLLAYRKAIFEDVKDSPVGHGRDRPAAKTTNIKLRKVYEFLAWCVANRQLPAKTIGPSGCKVASSLTVLEGKKGESSYRKKYPCCFGRIGESSRVDESQYWATEEDFWELEKYFREMCEPASAERNILLMRIGQFEAWRVGSSASLTIDQFTEKAMNEQKNADTYEICPPDQKIGYQYTFAMPWPLAYAIKKYIEGPRADLMTTRGIDERTAKFRVFLGTTKGRPIEPKSVSMIFSSAFRSLGRPKWAAYHAFRRYRAQQFAEEVIERRTRDGKSLTPDDVIDEIARLLGHSTREAQRAYVRAMKVHPLQSVEGQQYERIVALTLENSTLRTQLELAQVELRKSNRLSEFAEYG